MGIDDFDHLVETAAQLFGAALERGPGSQAEFYRAWDAVLADVLRRYPGASTGLVMYACGLAMGRWEAKHGLLPEARPSPARLH